MTGGWVPRWQRLLDSFGWGGEPPARRRRIASFSSGPEGIEAALRLGDEGRHVVRIAFLPLSPKVVDAVVRNMAGKARFAASLLSGRLPLDAESAFAGTGRSLLPVSPQEVRIACTCGQESDQAGLCPHANSVLPLLGERFDRDPLLLFELRGVDRSDLLARLKRHRAAPSPGAPPARLEAVRPPAREPLPEVRPDTFFRPPRALAPLPPLHSPSATGDAVLTRLGNLPFADPQASQLLFELHRAVGLGARERLAEWEWRKVSRRPSEDR